jgi:nickel-dependent lactate racemase
MLRAHKAGRDFVRKQAMVAVDEPYDIVITTNSGFPLDQNLYQTVKGMSAAVRIVREGGHIIMAAACEDGIPDHGRYLELLVDAGSPQGFLDMLAQPGFAEQDQWQVQIQALIQLKAEVHVFSENLSDEQIRSALFTPCNDITETVNRLAEKIGPGPFDKLRTGVRICTMPEGPQTIAYIHA